MPIFIDEVIADVEAPAGATPPVEDSADAPSARDERGEQRLLRVMRLAEERHQRLMVD